MKTDKEYFLEELNTVLGKKMFEIWRVIRIFEGLKQSVEDMTDKKFEEEEFKVKAILEDLNNL